MKYKSSIQITNSSHKAKKLFLEPWAEEFEMASGKTFDFVAEAEQEGNFEIEFGDSEIGVFAWSTSTVKVFCDGKELGVGDFERPLVPTVPKGQSVSSFLSLMLGKSE